MRFSSLIIFGISETKFVSFDPVLCLLNGSNKPYSVSIETFFCEYFQQHLDVHEFLKNLSFLCLRDFLQWKYPHKIYCVFLNNLVPGI